MNDDQLQFDRTCHVIYSKPCKAEIREKIAHHYPESQREAVWERVQMQVAPFDKDQPIYYEFTACPTAEFAKKHDLLEVMPALCNPDFAGMALIHARLIRKTTCSNGCKCDYTICGDKDPYCREHPEYRDEQGYRRNK